MSVQAMKAGAVEFLSKPFRDQALLDAIAQALARDRKQRDERASLSVLQQRFEAHTARERSVMELVVSGRPNKQVASGLGLSEATVKIHRQHVMQKMNAESLPQLVRMADLLSRHLPTS